MWCDIGVGRKEDCYGENPTSGALGQVTTLVGFECAPNRSETHVAFIIIVTVILVTIIATSTYLRTPTDSRAFPQG